MTTVFTVIYLDSSAPAWQGVFSSRELAHNFIRESVEPNKNVFKKDISFFEIVESELDDTLYSAVSWLKE